MSTDSKKGRKNFNGSTLTMDEWVMEAHHHRAWLHIHGILPDAQSDKVAERILKLVKAQHKKESKS